MTTRVEIGRRCYSELATRPSRYCEATFENMRFPFSQRY